MRAVDTNLLVRLVTRDGQSLLLGRLLRKVHEFPTLL